MRVTMGSLSSVLDAANEGTMMMSSSALVAANEDDDESIVTSTGYGQ